VLRLLLPQKDRERAIYGLKEKNIAKTFIKLIPLGPKDPDAIRLLDWKKPSGQNVGYPIWRLQLSISIAHSRGPLATFHPYFMKSSRNVLQLLKEASLSMSSTLLSTTFPEIFLRGEQSIVAYLLDFPYGCAMAPLKYSETHNLTS
jgi:hypothetical protein